MVNIQECLEWLSEMLDEKASRLCEHPSLEERNQLLRQWIILLSIKQRMLEEPLGLNKDSSTRSPERSAPGHNSTNQDFTSR